MTIMWFESKLRVELVKSKHWNFVCWIRLGLKGVVILPRWSLDNTTNLHRFIYFVNRTTVCVSLLIFFGSIFVSGL